MSLQQMKNDRRKRCVEKVSFFFKLSGAINKSLKHYTNEIMKQWIKEKKEEISLQLIFHISIKDFLQNTQIFTIGLFIFKQKKESYLLFMLNIFKF